MGLVWGRVWGWVGVGFWVSFQVRFWVRFQLRFWVRRFWAKVLVEVSGKVSGNEIVGMAMAIVAIPDITSMCYTVYLVSKIYI